MKKTALTVLAMSAALTLAACDTTSSGTLAQIGGALASVDCGTAAAGANGIAQQVITIAAKDKDQAAKDANLAAESAAILAAACPAIKVGTQVVINAVVKPDLAGTPSVNADAASTAAPKSAKRAIAPGKVISTDPWTYQVVVPAA